MPEDLKPADNYWKDLIRVESGNLILAFVVLTLVLARASDLWVGGVLGALLRGIESRRWPR